MALASPPPLTRLEVSSGRSDEEQLSASGTGRRDNIGDRNLGDTWRHIKHVTREVSKQFDLLDLLQNTRQEGTYQFPVQGVSRAWAYIMVCLGGACAACHHENCSFTTCIESGCNLKSQQQIYSSP